MGNLFGDIIHMYTREQALADEVLIDVSDMAKEVGFKFPVAVTSALWEIINNIPKEYSYQDKNGRLWDVLYMAAYNAKISSGNTINYKVIMHHEIETRKGKTIKENLILKAVIGPGDNYEPVITIMLPNED